MGNVLTSDHRKITSLRDRGGLRAGTPPPDCGYHYSILDKLKDFDMPNMPQ